MRSIVVRREVKEEGGKVFAVELEVDAECGVVGLRISGDFFAFPPEPLDSLEQSSAGRHVSELVDLASRALDRIVLAGVSRETALSVFRSVAEEAVTKCRGG